MGNVKNFAKLRLEMLAHRHIVERLSVRCRVRQFNVDLANDQEKDHNTKHDEKDGERIEHNLICR